MFLNSNYVLANEIVQNAGIHIANISNMIKQLENTNEREGVVVKYGNCTFINKTAKNLPNNLKEYIEYPGWTLTDFANKLPVTYLQSELGVSYDLLKESFGENGYDLGETEVAGKKFVVFPESFKKKMEGMTLYVLNEDDYHSCLENDDIQGGFALNAKKYLTWY